MEYNITQYNYVIQNCRHLQTVFFLPDKSCGIEASSNLIHHNPWVVFLEYWREDYRTEIRCTATLIDSLHVITAGHCIKKSKYTRYFTSPFVLI